MVEARGRTGRKPTSAEKRGGVVGKNAPATRSNRLDSPPTWRGAFLRAMAAAVVMLLISIVLLKKANQAVALFPLVLIVYVPISYYTDMWLYRRRQASKVKQAAAGKVARIERSSAPKEQESATKEQARRDD
jgi:hypothetical protein